MKITFSLLMLSLCFNALSQTKEENVFTTVDNQAYTLNYKESLSKIKQFLAQKNCKIEYQNETKRSASIHFLLNSKDYWAYDSLLNTIDTDASKKVNTVNNNQRVTELTIELNFLREKEKSYSELLAKMDEKSDNYLALWREQQTLADNINREQQELIRLTTGQGSYTVQLTLAEEMTNPENTRISFVNMPGAEFSYLSIESPTAGISAQNYQGYTLKYLFTRGKSYVSIGVYKNNTISHTDTAAFSDMLMYSFGQDFYSRHLGRGTRRFFNLYSGYSVGGILATGTTTKKDILYIAPSVGLELFKNKYILLDAKVSYFVPFSYNKNLRGVNTSLSLNIVF